MGRRSKEKSPHDYTDEELQAMPIEERTRVINQIMLTEPGDSSHGTSPDATQTNGDTPAKPAESKAMRFKRLGNHRLPAALKRIRALQNLGNRGQYEYSDEQAGKIIEALSTAVVAVQQAFTSHKADEMPWIL